MKIEFGGVYMSIDSSFQGTGMEQYGHHDLLERLRNAVKNHERTKKVEEGIYWTIRLGGRVDMSRISEGGRKIDSFEERNLTLQAENTVRSYLKEALNAGLHDDYVLRLCERYGVDLCREK